MQLETKFLRLRKLATVGDNVDGWRVCWLGGWDSSHLFYWVMVVRVKRAADLQQPTIAFFCTPIRMARLDKARRRSAHVSR